MATVAPVWSYGCWSRIASKFLRSARRMRRERNLTQAEVDRLAGMVIQVERGRREPKESTVQALRRALMRPGAYTGTPGWVPRKG